LNADTLEFIGIHLSVSFFGRQRDLPTILKAETLELTLEGGRNLFFSMGINEGFSAHIRRNNCAVVDGQCVLDGYSIAVRDNQRSLLYTPNSTNPFALEFRDLAARIKMIRSRSGNVRTSRLLRLPLYSTIPQKTIIPYSFRHLKEASPGEVTDCSQ